MPEAAPQPSDPGVWPIGRLLAAASRTVEKAWDDRLRAIDLTHAAVIVLDHLIRGGETGADTLAKAGRVQPQTMSRTLDRMERDGLVVRVEQPDDRRRRVVAATPRGRQAWDAARHVEREVLQEDPALRAALLRVLDQL